MQNLHRNKKQYRMEEFSKVQGKSMVDLSILKTEAFKLVQKEFEKAFKEAADYMCICCKREYQRKCY